MKNLMQGILCLLLLCTFINSNAQTPPVKEPDTNRPSLFQLMPQQAICHIADMETLLDKEVGSFVNMQIADNLHLVGTITSVATKYDNKIKSVVIRSTNFQGASLTFSKVTKEDGFSYFTGRIISFQHADAYELVFEKGTYSFVKKGFYDLVND